MGEGVSGKALNRDSAAAVYMMPIFLLIIARCMHYEALVYTLV